jgi:hypothetical protein
MTLRKIWTTQFERFGRAAYAEQNDVFIDNTVAEIRELMDDTASRFYKVEIKENGAYVGYFIIRGQEISKAYIRPHFSEYLTEFNNLLAGMLLTADDIEKIVSEYYNR